MADDASPGLKNVRRKIEFTNAKIREHFCKAGCSTVGSVPGLGPGGRRFESCHPDNRKEKQFLSCFSFSFYI